MSELQLIKDKIKSECKQLLQMYLSVNSSPKTAIIGVCLVEYGIKYMLNTCEDELQLNKLSDLIIKSLQDFHNLTTSMGIEVSAFAQTENLKFPEGLTTLSFFTDLCSNPICLNFSEVLNSDIKSIVQKYYDKASNLKFRIFDEFISFFRDQNVNSEVITNLEKAVKLII